MLLKFKCSKSLKYYNCPIYYKVAEIVLLL